MIFDSDKTAGTSLHRDNENGLQLMILHLDKSLMVKGQWFGKEIRQKKDC